MKQRKMITIRGETVELLDEVKVGDEPYNSVIFRGLKELINETETERNSKNTN